MTWSRHRQEDKAPQIPISGGLDYDGSRGTAKTPAQASQQAGEEYLEGEWRVSVPPDYRYEIEERNHEMRPEYWGGYTRHNALYQKRFDLAGTLIGAQLIVQNSAIMMYSPFLQNSFKTPSGVS